MRVSLWIVFFWIVTFCSLVGGYGADKLTTFMCRLSRNL